MASKLTPDGLSFFENDNITEKFGLRVDGQKVRFRGNADSSVILGNLSDPTDDGDAVTKQYLDSLLSEVQFLSNTQTATSTNVVIENIRYFQQLHTAKQ
eukprot:Pgem_evm2s19931